MSRAAALALPPLAVALALLPACAGSAARPAPPPAVVQRPPGGGEARLRLTASAVARLGLRTARVAEGPAGAVSVPYSALLYGRDGRTWVYVSPAPLVFVRRAVTVAAIAGPVARLAAGPPRGALVVSEGGAELHGLEFGVVQ